jgi:superfamily II DNA helicase RecQ
MGELDRTTFEELLAAMGRADLLAFHDAVFEKDGKQIPYRTVQLTRAGQLLKPEEMPPLQLRVTAGSRRTGRRAATKRATKLKRQASWEESQLTAALRQWRLVEAKSKAVPAFRIFSDQVLYQLAEDRPMDEADLLSIPGIRPALVKRYGDALLKVIAAN